MTDVERDRKVPPTPETMRFLVTMRALDNAKPLGAILLFFAGSMGVLWVVQPIAEDLAGQETVLSVSIALTLSVVLGVAELGTLFGWKQSHDRVKALEKRNTELEQQIKHLEGETKTKPPPRRDKKVRRRRSK